MNDEDRGPRVCFVCKGSLEPGSRDVLEVYAGERHNVFRAHNECLEGLYRLLSAWGKKPAGPIVHLKKTCSSLLQDLYVDGWFTEDRKLADVLQKTKEAGYNYDKSTVANALAALVRTGLLTRRRSVGEYCYVQKRPSE